MLPVLMSKPTSGSLRCFDEGTPEVFIKTIQAFEQIWAQNLVNNANDCEATGKDGT